jgi:hypothetical protein
MAKRKTKAALAAEASAIAELVAEDNAWDNTLDKSNVITDLIVNSKELAHLSAHEKAKAVEIIQLRFKREDSAKDFDIVEGKVIEMELMLGGKIVIKEPMAYQVMSAQKEMAGIKDQAIKNEMRPVYTMVASADISDTVDGEEVMRPMIMEDLQDRVSARDYEILVHVFRSINLL